MGASPVDLQQLTTTDPDVGHAALDAAFGDGRPLRFSTQPTGFELRIRSRTVRDLGVDELRASATTSVAMLPRDYLLVGWLGHGRFDRLRVGRRPEARLERGDVYAYPAGEPVSATWTDLGVRSVRLPSELLERVARETSGVRGPVRFDGTRPVSELAARRWRLLHGFVAQELLEEGPLGGHELLVARSRDLLAAAALATFPNSTLVDAERGRLLASPSSVRRAVAHIEEHADEALTVTDIARAAGVTPRALQQGFRRHLDATPMAYLRAARLERAHLELQRADPPTTTVADVARRWGFASAGRFASSYRERYGRSPATTLRA